MRDDYTIEDAHMESCTHPSSFIIHERLCEQCGKILESDIIEPGTDVITHHITHRFTP